jgi:hypothetical protein
VWDQEFFRRARDHALGAAEEMAAPVALKNATIAELRGSAGSEDI